MMSFIVDDRKLVTLDLVSSIPKMPETVGNEFLHHQFKKLSGLR